MPSQDRSYLYLTSKNMKNCFSLPLMSLYPAERTRSAFPVSGALNEDRQTCSDAVFPEVDDFSQKTLQYQNPSGWLCMYFSFCCSAWLGAIEHATARNAAHCIIQWHVVDPTRERERERPDCVTWQFEKLLSTSVPKYFWARPNGKWLGRTGCSRMHVIRIINYNTMPRRMKIQTNFQVLCLQWCHCSMSSNYCCAKQNGKAL